MFGTYDGARWSSSASSSSSVRYSFFFSLISMWSFPAIESMAGSIN